MAKILQKTLGYVQRSSDVNVLEWTIAKFTPLEIVAKYSLPLAVLVASDETTFNKRPAVNAGQVFNLETRVSVEQVTAKVIIPSRERRTNRQLPGEPETPVVINIPQRYPGPFKVQYFFPQRQFTT